MTGRRLRLTSPLLLAATVVLIATVLVRPLSFASAQEATALDDSLCTNGTVITDHANKAGLVTDCENLIAAVNHWRTNTANSRWIPNWSATREISNWEGVSVSGDPPRVTGLNMNRNGKSKKLRGRIPAEVGNLSELRSLNFGWNYLNGSVPAGIWTLTKLTTLALENNRLSGSIPVAVGDLTELTVLGLNDNDFTGSIPTQIGNLTKLTSLLLHSNARVVDHKGPGFTGSIPAELENLTSLTTLYLHNNNLSGPIPDLSGGSDSTRGLRKLTRLALYSNNLTGDLPAWLPQLTELQSIHLHDNQLTGTIPAGLGNLSELLSLQLHRNDLTGTIPPVLATPPLITLNLSGNMLTGCIPDALYDIQTNDMAYVNHDAYYDYETESEVAADLLQKCSEATPAIILSKTALSVTEGDRAGNSYTVRLQKRPAATVVVTVSGHAGELTLDRARLTFTTSTWSIEQTITLTADDHDSRDETLTLTHTAGGASEYVGKTATLEVTVYDDDTPGVTVATDPPTDPLALTLVEGGNDTYTVVLDSEPAATVTVTITRSGTSGITVNKDALAFTTGNWDTPQVVTVSAIEDGNVDAESATITHTVTSTDTQYDGISAEGLSVTASDNDTPGVAVRPTSLPLAEGGETQYTVVLTSQPSDDVVVDIASGRSDVKVDQSSLTFTSTTWDTVRTVKVSKDEDNIPSGNGTVTITNTVSTTDAGYSSVTAADVSVQVTDNDSPGVVVRPTSLSVDEGESETYTVMLATQPSANVTVTIGFGAGSSSDVTADESTLTFTDQDWGTPQEVRVSAAEDDADTTNDTATIEHAVTSTDSDYSGISADDVAVEVIDDDEVAVKVNPASLSIPEGGQKDYTVVLGSQPSADVTVNLALATGSSEEVTLTTASDTSVTTTSLTFTPDNWATEQTVTVETAVDDDSANDSATIEHTVTTTDTTGYASLSTVEVPVTVTEPQVPLPPQRPAQPDPGVQSQGPGQPNPAVRPTVDPVVSVSFEKRSYAVDEGATVTVKVTLSIAPSRQVTIPLRATGQGGVRTGDYSGIPASVTFDSNETEVTFGFIATQDAEDDDGENVTIAFGRLPSRVQAGSIRETTVSITDDDDPEVSVSFEQLTYTVAEGSSVKIKVMLSADPERSVVIPFDVTDMGGVTGADYSGVPRSLTFNNGETLKSFTFEASSDTDDDDGESVRIAFDTLPAKVSPGARDETVVRITDDDVPEVAVRFEQAHYTVDEGSTVTVRVTLSADPERLVTIPLSATGQDGAGPGDYSGVPEYVMFNRGETRKSFVFTAVQDTDDDDGESVRIVLGELPTSVTAGAPDETTVSITDDDITVDEEPPEPPEADEPPEPEEPEEPVEPEEAAGPEEPVEPKEPSSSMGEPDTGTGLREQRVTLSVFLAVVVLMGALLAVAHRRR